MIGVRYALLSVLIVAGCGEGTLNLDGRGGNGSGDATRAPRWEEAPELNFDEDQLMAQGYIRYMGDQSDYRIVGAARYFHDDLYLPVDPKKPILTKSYALEEGSRHSQGRVCSALWEFPVVESSKPLVRVTEVPRLLQGAGQIAECLVFGVVPRRVVVSDDWQATSFSPAGDASRTYQARRDSLAVLSPWVPLANDPLPILATPKAAWTGERVLVYGLKAGTRAFQLAAFDPVQNRWDVPQDEGPGEFRGEFAATMAEGRLVVTDGLRGAVYDPKANAWGTLPLEGAPFADEGIGRVPRLASGDGKLFLVVSTLRATSPMQAEQSFAMMDLVSGEWKVLTSAPEMTQHLIHGIHWTGRDLVLWFHGLEGEPDRAFRFFWQDESWTDISPGGHAYQVVMAGDKLTAFRQESAMSYDFEQGRWHDVYSWRSLEGSGLASTTSGLVTFGGFVEKKVGSEQDLLSADLRYYLPKGGRWFRVPKLADAPQPRSEAAVVWTGVEVFVWGGCGLSLGGNCKSWLAGGHRLALDLPR